METKKPEEQIFNKDKTIVRQNQTQHCREYLSRMGYIQHLNSYEFTIYVELMTDFCYFGLTKSISERLQKFDKLMNDRIIQVEIDGVIY